MSNYRILTIKCCSTCEHSCMTEASELVEQTECNHPTPPVEQKIYSGYDQDRKAYFVWPHAVCDQWEGYLDE